MKSRKQFWVVIAFAVLSVLPFFPVARSISKLRHSVIFDSPIQWQEGQEQIFKIPALKSGDFELRIEADASDWQPTVKLTWNLLDSGQHEIAGIANPEEIMIIRPIAKIQIHNDLPAENELKLHFFNSNPAKHAIRVKLGLDRDALLADSAHQFLVYLAISLVLTLLLWRSLTR